MQTNNEMKSGFLVYLDHNILDSMLKGDPHKVGELLNDSKYTPVFSDENLKEIQRSKGYESCFLDKLKDIKARHIKQVLDSNFIPTGKAEVQMVDPSEALSLFIETTQPYHGVDYGLTGMLQKSYGGLSDTTFQEIFDKGGDNLLKMLNDSFSATQESDTMSPAMKAKVQDAIGMLTGLIPSINSSLSELLDNGYKKSPIQTFEEMGISPKTLKNIRGPNVLVQVFEAVKAKLPNVVDLQSFFLLNKTTCCSNQERKPTLAEQVNSIYHQLNFLGYYRDKKLFDEKRFTASFSDMTHAGMASFCHLFLCGDHALVMKAAAAYEFLGVTTRIAHLNPEKKPTRGPRTGKTAI